MDASVTVSPLTFFTLRAATSWHLRNRRWSAGRKCSSQKSALWRDVNYYLKEALPAEAAKKDNDDKDKKDAAGESRRMIEGRPPEKKEGKVKITVVDKDGKPVRELTGRARRE